MRTKKILVTIIIMALAILGMSTQVNATQYKTYSQTRQYKVGDIVRITMRNKNREDRNLLCIKHNQAMIATTDYTVKSVVTIRGRVSTDQKGKSIDSWYNAKMAYIAADQTKYKNVWHNAKQYAMWNYIGTWLAQVGHNHAGLSKNFGYNWGSSNNLIREAEEYANSVKETEVEMKNNTNIKNVLKNVKEVEVNEKSYIKVGPFNLSFPGNLSELTAYDQDNKTISKISYAVSDGKNLVLKKLGEIKSDKNFYILIPTNSDITKITKIVVKTDYEIKTAELTFFYTKKSNWQNLIRARGNTEKESKEITLPDEIPFTGNLKVIKIDKNDKTKKLKDVEFIIKNVKKDKYVNIAEDGTINFVSEKNATKFVTNKNGEILIKDLPFGTYEAYETKNPNYGYEILKEGKKQEVTVNKTKELKIENEQKLIKLSGYVWEDIPANKTTERNGYYKTNIDGKHSDPLDTLVEGVTVRLKDKNNNAIVKNAKGIECVTKTDSNGAYEFADVSIPDLENYYVEFEYDYLTYENVTPHLDHSNGSKAGENEDARNKLNSEFVSIEGTGETTGVSKDENGNVTHNLKYNRNVEKITSEFINDGSYRGTADTLVTKFNIKDSYKPGEEKIENINLGLCRRDQPDLGLKQDLNNVKITLNGFAHIYEYNNYLKNLDKYDETDSNIGVKYRLEEKDRLGNEYTRAVYRSDLDFVTEDHRNELEVYATYELRIENKSNLYERANTIVDYYSKDYELLAIGTELDEKSNIVNKYIEDTDYTKPTDYNANYKTTTIKTKDFVKNLATNVIYLQFKLNRETVLGIINGEKDLENVAEITSYSVQDKNGKAYAGVDNNSNPGNAVLGNKTTYEDDTDFALALKLEIADARIMTGIVFLDTTPDGLATANIREGDGIYNGEKGIEGVDIKLTEKNSGKEYTAQTGKDGKFTIEGYIPGNYTLTYNWGNEEYKVEDFKGTIYNEKERMNDPTWYKTTEPRYSDAIDNWETRQKIDKENSEIKTMDSTTPEMKIGIEYDTTYTLSPEEGLQYGISVGNKFIYHIDNIDFGIVERARQEIKLDKNVKAIKVTLANDQVLVDAKINDAGKLEGQIEGVTNEPPMQNNLGFVKAEIDKELIQGSTLEIGYEIKAKNISELDYVSADGYYYLYGEKQASDANKLGNVLKLNIIELRDYLDSTLAYDETDESKWEVQQSDKEGKILLTTSDLSKDLAPGEENEVTIQASKLISNQQTNIFNNEAKITNIARTPEITTGTPYGRKPNLPEDPAEQVIISTPTGENLNYVLPIAIGLSTLIILGLGVVIIKKKVIKE